MAAKVACMGRPRIHHALAGGAMGLDVGLTGSHSASGLRLRPNQGAWQSLSRPAPRVLRCHSRCPSIPHSSISTSSCTHRVLSVFYPVLEPCICRFQSRSALGGPEASTSSTSTCVSILFLFGTSGSMHPDRPASFCGRSWDEKWKEISRTPRIVEANRSGLRVQSW